MMPDWQNPPYDQAAEDDYQLDGPSPNRDAEIAELQGEVEELRVELLATYDKADAYGRKARQSESAANNYRKMLRLSQDETSHVSHPDWIQRGLLTMLGLILAFLVFTAGYAAGHKSRDPFTQDGFPCQEDEVLGYSPAFGPDRVGCLQVDLLAP